MAVTFAARAADLRRMTGAPHDITVSVEFNQVYAHRQHEDLSYRHPRGGEPEYLHSALFRHYRDFLAAYAAGLTRDGGRRSLTRSAEHLSDEAERRAPREWGDLMRSGHPRVTCGRDTWHDREPGVHRLTKAELRAKSRAVMRMRMAEGLTVYFMRHGKVMVIPGRNEPHGLRGRL